MISYFMCKEGIFCFKDYNHICAGLSGLDMVQVTDSSELSPGASSTENIASLLMPPPAVPDLPPGCPPWACRLKKCEVRGRGLNAYGI